MRKLDLRGQRYGHLLVISEMPASGSQSQWLCRCDCGAEVVVQLGNLRSGHTKSCGCLKVEAQNRSHLTHGLAGTRLYKTWVGMKTRCYNKGHPKYPIYGGRGIQVCDEWRTSFESFKEWATSHGYADDLTIDRIDVNGNYEPDNCRWATVTQQARNKTRTVFYKGKCATEWCENLGLPKSTFRSRFYTYGWPIEKALFTPIRKFNKSTHKGTNK